MSISINFVDRNSDLETLNKSYESLPVEQQQELEKALKKDGLVLVDVQVQGKHGVYTRKQWKKASDVKKDSGKSAKAAQTDDKGSKPIPQVIKGKHLDDLKNNLKEHGLVVDSAYGRKISDGEEVIMYSTDGKKTYTATANVYSDGGIELRKVKEQKDDKADNVVSEEGVSKKYVTKYLSVLGGVGHESMVKNAEQVLSGESKEFISQKAKDEAIKATEKCKMTYTAGKQTDENKKIAEHCDSIKKKLENTPVKGQRPETPSVKSGNVGKDFTVLIEAGDNDSDTVKMEKEAHNMCVGRLKSRGIDLKDSKAVSKELMGYAIELRETMKNTMQKKEKEHYKDLSDTINNWSDEYNASKSTAKTPSPKKDTNQPKPEPKSLAKSKPTAESKNAVKAASKKHDVSKVMEAAKKAGVEWKESDHAGINWMRCAMALSQHEAATPGFMEKTLGLK